MLRRLLAPLITLIDSRIALARRLRLEGRTIAADGPVDQPTLDALRIGFTAGWASAHDGGNCASDAAAVIGKPQRHIP